MRFFTTSLLLLALVCSCAAPVPKGKLKDEEAIVGTWKLDKLDGEDQAATDELSEMTFEFKGGKHTMSSRGKTVNEGSYKLDPEAKVKTMDFIVNKRTIPAIYELDGDALKICYGRNSNPVRPTEMKSDGEEICVLTFKRVKEEK